MQNYHLKLKGFVGGYDFDASYVDYILSKNQNKPVDILIDSLGGSLATALSIVASFRQHGNVHVHYVGMNASAATIVSMGAAKVTMDSSAMYLVHKCSSEFFKWASLNADQLEQQIQQLTQMKTDLEKMDANVAKLYAAKCKKKTCAELLDLMKVGGWLTAQEAKQWGFVDEITDEQDDNAPVLTEATACAMAAAGIPLPALPIVKPEERSFFAALYEFFTGHARKTEAPATEPAAQVKPEPQDQQPVAPQANQSQSNDMKTLFPLIVAAVGLTDAAFQPDENGNLTLTKDQFLALESALKENRDKVEATIADHLKEIQAKDATIASMQAKIDELGKQPGATTQQVLNNPAASPQAELTDEERFIAEMNSAQQLYNSLP